MRLSGTKTGAINQYRGLGNQLWDLAGNRPSLDLPFADNKSLVDATTGANLVDFTRASSGTYVDSEGVIRTATTNLLLQSEDFSTTWGNTESSENVNVAVAPNGTTTADALVDTVNNSSHSISQSVAGCAGSTSYTFSCYMKKGSKDFGSLVFSPNASWGTGGGATVFFDLTNGTISGSYSATGTIQALPNGWYRCTATATTVASPGTVILRVGSSLTGSTQTYQGNGDEAIYIWGAQLEQSSTVGEYIPTTSTINSAPRFDHDPTTGESLGLLVEEQRTNLLLRSEKFETTWTRTNVAAFGSGSEVNVETAPNGTLTADLVALTGSINSGTGFIYQDITKAATATTYTATVFAKAQDWDALLLQVNDASTNNNRANVTFSLTTGQITTAAAAVGTFSAASAAATSFGNGWFRASLTFTSSTETGLRIRIYPDNSTTVTSNGSNGIYIWGAQLEAGSFPTSYIPTTDAAATRAADVASIDSGNFSSWYRQDEGTVFAEFQPRANATAGVAYLNAGSVNEATRIFYDSTISNYTFSVRADSVEQSSINNLGAYVLQSERISAAYKVNDLAASRNGGASVSDVSATLPTGIDRLDLGTTQGPNYLNGTIRRFTYWPARLPDSTLQTITQ